MAYEMKEPAQAATNTTSPDVYFKSFSHPDRQDLEPVREFYVAAILAALLLIGLLLPYFLSRIEPYYWYEDEDVPKLTLGEHHLTWAELGDTFEDEGDGKVPKRTVN